MATQVFITAIRLSENGETHESISHVWYSEVSKEFADGQARKTVADAVSLIETNQWAAKVYNPSEKQTVDVIVVRASPKHLRTCPDRTRRDNLLSLPRK